MGFLCRLVLGSNRSKTRQKKKKAGRFYSEAFDPKYLPPVANREHPSPTSISHSPELRQVSRKHMSKCQYGYLGGWHMNTSEHIGLPGCLVMVWGSQTKERGIELTGSPRNKAMSKVEGTALWGRGSCRQRFRRSEVGGVGNSIRAEATGDKEGSRLWNGLYWLPLCPGTSSWPLKLQFVRNGDSCPWIATCLGFHRDINQFDWKCHQLRP